jgi:tripeptide aminopeptidase
MMHPEKDRLLEVFLDLARIGSLSGRERALADYVLDRARSLGVDLTEDGAGADIDGDCGNLVGSLPGRNCDGPAIMFAGHMDTVGPCDGIEPVVEDGKVTSAGDTVLGGDDKVAVAAMLEVMALLQNSDRPHVPVTFCFTVAEETGLLGARHLDLAAIDARCAFVPDGSGMPGDTVIGAPTHVTYRVECIGRASHAGIEPEKGVNAIRFAAEAISGVPQGLLDDETTANIGVIEGGSATNVVPDKVTVRGEVRSHDSARALEIVEDVRILFETAAAKAGGKIVFDQTIEYEAFRLAADHPAVTAARKAAGLCGLDGVETVSNGGSDASVFNEGGIPAVVLATGTENVHSKNETVYIDRLVAVAQWLLAIVDTFGKLSGNAEQVPES